MVFESIVTELMNKYLKAYIENLDSSQLKLGLWGGDAVLENLHVKGDALKELNLPITIKSGFIGKLTLKIPWKNLYKEAVVATLDSLYVLAVPNTSIEYDAEKEAEQAEKEKQEQLQEMEERMAKKLEIKDGKPKEDGFVEKLATQVIKNIQVHVKHIHVRYEDDVTTPGQPTALGVTLNSLDLQTTNENWVPTLLDESVKIIYKMVSLNALSVYWNTKPKILLSKASREEQLKAFKETIANEGFVPEHFNYIIKPLTMEAKLRLNPHPENELSKPKILLDVVLKKLGLHLSCLQFHNLMELVDSLDRMSINSPYRKFKPKEPLKGNVKVWWKYAYDSIVDGDVRRKMQMFSWDHIKEHRRKVKAYKKLYKEKLKKKSASKDLAKSLLKMENELDVFNITLARQSAEVELVKAGVTIKNKKSALQLDKKSSSTSWFGGWFGGGKKQEQVEEKEEEKDTIDTIMDAKEKAQLYEAIGYSEGEGPAKNDFPKDYVEISVNAAVNSVSLQLEDDKHYDGASLLNLSLNGITTGFKMLPTIKGISVVTEMKDFTVDGFEQEGSVPHVIMSDFGAEANLPAASTDTALLAVKFEKNPLHESCDQRIVVGARPLRIVYDAATINSLIEFFKPPEDIQLQQLRAVAAAAYEDIKDQTATGLKYAMATRTITEISVKVMSTYVVVPKKGKYSEGCEVAVLDLGEVVLQSMNEGQTPERKEEFFTDDKSDLQEMQSKAYDKFLIKVNKIQLLLAGEGEDWVVKRTLDKSPLHVLEPLNVKLLLEKCIVANDPSLPKLRLRGELPIFSLRISDKKLKNAIELGTSIPLPPPGPDLEAQLVEYDPHLYDDYMTQKKDLKNMDKVFVDKYASSRSLSSSVTTSSEEFFTAESDLSDMDEATAGKIPKIAVTKQASIEGRQQLTDVQASFLIGKMTVSVADGDKEMLELSVEKFGANAVVRTFDTHLDAFLGSVRVEYMPGTLPDNRPMYLIDTPAHDDDSELLKVDILIAKKISPEFLTTYENTEQKLNIKFNALEVNANSKALLEIKDFSERLIPPPQQAAETPESVLAPDDSKSTVTAVTPVESATILSPGQFVFTRDTASSGSGEETPEKTRKKKKQKRKSNKGVKKSEIVNIKLSVVLDTFSVNLSDEKRHIASLAIEGIATTITMQPSRTTVEAKLHNLLIIDPFQETIYHQIVSAEGEDIIDANVIVYKNATAGERYRDMSNIDTGVNVKLGSMRVVFIKRFIDTMIEFAKNFQDAKEVAAEAGAAAQKAATESMSKLVQRNPRIKLNVFLSVPNIYVPRNSMSLEVIALNLGNVKVNNSFSIVGSEDTETPAVCDQMEVRVHDIKISLCRLSDSHYIASENKLLEPISASVDIKRNLSSSWFHGVPDVAISGSVPDISVNISEADFARVMGTLTENLAEGADSKESMTEPEIVPTVQAPVKAAAEEKDTGTIAERSAVALRQGEVWDSMKMDFSLAQVKLNLYSDQEREHPLAEVLISGLGLDMRMGSDTSMDLHARLQEISLQDMRKDHQQGITKYITRKLNREQSPETYKYVVNASLAQKSDGSLGINASIGSLQIILCLEFILKVTNFFLKSLPREQLPEPEVATEKQGIMKAVSAESILSETTTVVPRPHEAEAEKSKAIHIDLKLYEPDIVLVTDISSSDCQALVLSMKLTMKFDVSESGREQKLAAEISRLQLVNCPFSEVRNITDEYKRIIEPCIVNVKAILSETVQDISIDISKIQITTTPMVIKTISEVAEIFATQSKSETELGTNVSSNQVQSDIWDRKNVSDMNFWFIENPDKELKAKRSSRILQKVASTSKKAIETMKLSIPNIMVLLECGHGRHTVPLLISELKVGGEVNNWSGGQMEGNFKLALGVIYFNESLSVWEPLVEPVETNPGELTSKYELWMVEAGILQNASNENALKRIGSSSSSSSEEDLPPRMSVSITSQKLLHTTITNDALKVLHSLGRAFADAAASKSLKSKKQTEDEIDGFVNVAAEGQIRNMLDMPLNIAIGKDLKVVARSGPDKNQDGQYSVAYKGYIAVDYIGEENLGISELLSSQAKSHASKNSTITVSLPGGKNSAVFDLSKTGTRLHTLDQNGSNVEVVCVIESQGGMRTITLRSPLKMTNHLSTPIQVVDKDDKVIGDIAKNRSFPLPVRFNGKEKLFIKVPGMNVQRAELDLASMRGSDDFHFERVLKLASNSDTVQAVRLNIEILSEQVDSADNNDTCYEIHVRPVAVFKNFLPFDIEYTVANNGKSSATETLKPGTGKQMLSAEMKMSRIKAKLSYLNKAWTGDLVLENGISELSVWTFRDDQDNSMVLGKQVTYVEGFMKITLYSPYWMVNDTGFPLDYKGSDDNIAQHPEKNQDFVLFSFTSKSFLSKNKLQLRVCNSNFSDGFSIDAVGSTGTITCKAKEFNYMIGTKIALTSFGLTKLVTFSSYYTIVNKSSEDLEIVEAEDTIAPVLISAKSKCLFWPESKSNRIRIRLKGNSDSISPEVQYSRLDSGVLVKVGDVPLFIDVSVTECSVTMTIKNYYIGSSAVMLVNHTKDFNIRYKQLKVDSKIEIGPGKVQHYLWPKPDQKRDITWNIAEGGKEVSHDVLHERAGEVKFKVDGKERLVYYAVFIDGLQRVLLFTECKKCADAVEQGLGTEQANIDVSVELQGLSCSITDTKARREVMYMAITSSGIVWEEKPKRRWTALALKYGSALEENYQKSNQANEFVAVENYRFDLSKMKVVQPRKAELRRSFSPGISMQYTITDHQVMIHAKINRIQVDNQLPTAVFPVVLHPMPMPKTVAIDSSPKPFVEFSLMQRKSEHQTFTHIKYFKVLVQEFSVKVDMGFISALLPVFGANEVKNTPERELKYFNYDIMNAKKATDETEEGIHDDSGITFYDILHLSPIKVHVSFSLQNSIGGENSDTSVVELPFNALAVVLKSIGVTVSDIDDVVFKLGYFERQYQFFSVGQFQNAITMHYAGQAIKQLYVLVFGLDVIGNPYGLVMGIAEGVTDLFYEPYQGMIQGPEEFAEGLALGAISLLGHTVGGAAGAVSRVTGALGKGVASLTMDDEYKKKRQMQKNKPADLKEGLARGGKGLVMGIVGGVTGVVTKPVEGAKKEGAAGFFKGVGKGLIGIVARPASGVIDLASNTFEGIQKLADMSEDVKRMRPARWINGDTGVLQPYRLKKAQGNAILMEVEKGKFAEGAKYVEHVSIDKDKKSFLMLTNKAILEAHTGEIFGQWNSAWSFPYEEVSEEPSSMKEGEIKLVGAKTKKLFGSKAHTKIITFHDKDNASHIFSYMLNSWNDAQEGLKRTSSQKENPRGMSFRFSSMREKFPT